MKFAYVSLVVSSSEIHSSRDLRAVDLALSPVTYAHELILVVPFQNDSQWDSEIDFECPLTVLRVDTSASPDSATVAGLARAAGDFVIEWRGELRDLTSNVVRCLLEPSNFGYELVEATECKQSRSTTFFYAVVNKFRPWSQPVRQTVARVFSRNAIGILLANARTESLMPVLVADLPVMRRVIQIPVEIAKTAKPRRELWASLSLLSKGTKLGALVPLALAVISGTFGTASALYAVLIITVRGRAPEGWTTLMVLTGLGQASILVMIGLIWSRIDALARGLSRRSDVTVKVETLYPRNLR